MKSKRPRRGDLQQALDAYGSGNSSKARKLLEALLVSEPDHRAALDALSTLEFRAQRLERAAGYLRRLVALAPDDVNCHLNLGEVERRLGHSAKAAECFKRALDLKPDFAEALINLGVVLKDAGEASLAVSVLERAVDLQLNVPAVQALFAQALTAAGEGELARLHERCAALLGKAPPAAEASAATQSWIAARGSAKAGAIRAAVAGYHVTLALRPGAFEAWLELSWLLRDLGRVPGAVLAARRALALRSDDVAGLTLLAATLADAWQLEEALTIAERATSLDPMSADAHYQRGRAVLGRGDVNLALASFRKATELDSSHRAAHGGQIFCMSYVTESTPSAVALQARAWAAAHTPAFVSMARPHRNVKAPGRRLKLGYVSEDFRSHPIANFIVPLLKHHDASAFEVYCYSSARSPDAVTHLIQGSAAVFRDVAQINDSKLVDIVRDDGIDVLVDLALFSGNHRLRAFAARPAPVQLTYLAYLGTSGVPGMQYRVTAPGLDDPTVDAEDAFTERPLMLPSCYWCYDPLEAALYPNDADAVAAPALRNGNLTFGSQNSFHKLSDETLELWARVLSQVPTSRLLAHAAPTGVDRVLRAFARHGVARERVSLLPRRRRSEYLQTFRTIDVCLDTVPFNGVTTTLDAFWMGTPTLTLRGQTPPGRAAASVCAAIGLSQLIADSPEELVQKAQRMSEDLVGLAQLRSELRDKLRASPLMDAPRFVRDLEALYRRAWCDFCES